MEFAEVFADGGFDIVLANPPYVRQELIKHLKSVLQKVYPAVYAGTADLYCYFYARALQLLRSGGMLAFISSNKWFRANYGVNLRKHLAAICRIHSITDFGELPVFPAATFPMIFIAQKGTRSARPTIFTQVKSLEPPYPDVLALTRHEGIQLPPDAIKGASWTLTDAASADRLRQMEKVGVPLGKYIKDGIYRGVLTGFNTAFVIDAERRAQLIAEDSKSEEIIKPLAVGDDIRKWRIAKQNRWLIFTRRGINIETYPAIKAHLRQWKPELTPKKISKETKGRKPGSYKWYEIQDDITYYAAFEQHKIVFPEIAKEPRFAFDRDGTFVNNKGFIIPSDDLYLLGVLNSALAWGYAKSVCAVLGDENKGGRLMLQWVNFRRLPIPDASTADRTAIAKLVKRCLNADGIGCETWEKEIDERVAGLYGL